MTYIIDRLILIVLSILILGENSGFTEIIVISLISVFISGICYYVDNKYVAVCVGLAYVICLLYFPVLVYIAPVIMYELFSKRNYVGIGVLAAVNFFSFIAMEDVSTLTMVLLFVLEVVACVLNYKTEKIQSLHNINIHIRDDSEERNLLLAEKNRHLIEKQDSEIYVATLRERNRIARDIHDNVGHILTRSILQIGALMTINKQEPIHGQLEAVKNNLDEAMNNVRESVHDLHDESIDLKQAIGDLIEEIKDNFHCNLDYDISNSIDRKYKYAIIGVVREAISNVIKHSSSDNVDIIIREHPGMYQLIIHDYKDKKITYLDEVKDLEGSQGIGIQNMQDRVYALKGNISIDTGNGYKIFITFPK